ncbi:glycosyltransferase family 32 protein [Lactobacillus crispatus]|uniref:glycosyltransferase family 32 protein n=1 Tax=Lactobacillus crispatus TaxID=47770 RepID=UPI000772F9D2|nr:glycosyltransferase [Lactobacillus crispatus]
MIPKIIHFIWLGNNEIDKNSQICINSAKRLLPDYQINIWTENNINIEEIRESNKFFDECLKKKLWAFASDYLRLYILAKYGGIYLDTDVEVIKKFDDLLGNKCFMGLEEETNGDTYIGTGVIGAEPNSVVIDKILGFYDEQIWNVEYYNNPIIFKNVLFSNKELQKYVKIYPKYYFCPYVPYSKELYVNVASDTYTIHWYNANWNLSCKGYMFITTKYIDNPVLKFFVKIKRYLGYKKRAFLKNR